jgi:hypothetical protein
MRKKEAWMKKGTQVLANGKMGVITQVQENKNLRGDGIDYVYYIFVKLNGVTFDQNYHPNYVQELIPVDGDLLTKIK